MSIPVVRLGAMHHARHVAIGDQVDRAPVVRTSAIMS
jgi:hypothetical protein